MSAGELVGGRADWERICPLSSQTAFGGNRNPEESGGIRRNLEESGANTGIPVRQEF